MGEAGTHLAVRCPSQPDRDQRNLTNTSKKPRPLETWPRDREAKTFGDSCREAETLEDLTETAEDHKYLADGRLAPWESDRWPNPITINTQTEISEANPPSKIR